ncbi:MAG: hypothetical protein V4722_15550 [Bacteroidota bacterium]
MKKYFLSVLVVIGALPQILAQTTVGLLQHDAGTLDNRFRTVNGFCFLCNITHLSSP